MIIIKHVRTEILVDNIYTTTNQIKVKKGFCFAFFLLNKSKVFFVVRKFTIIFLLLERKSCFVGTYIHKKKPTHSLSGTDRISRSTIRSRVTYQHNDPKFQYVRV